MTMVENLIKIDQRYPALAGTDLIEKMFIYSYVRMMNFKSIIEIGVNAGHMTCWLAGALEENGGGKMISVDNWQHLHGGTLDDEKKAAARLGILATPRVDHTFIRASSQDWLPKQKSDSFDFVWVDGHHGHDEALIDVNEAHRCAIRAVSVHDTNQDYLGPKAACMAQQSGFYVNGFRGIWIRDLNE